MNQLAAICVKRPVFATVLILVLVVFGGYSYLKLGVDRFPKVDFPIVTVTTVRTGSAPEEIETDITDKIEQAVNTVSGIDELRSISSEGISQVFVTFKLEKNIDVAAQDVRDKVNRILPDLPKDIDQPTVEKMDPDAMPILTIAVASKGVATIRDVTEYCDKKLRRQLESISGVGQVMIVGGQARQINVYLDPAKMRSQKLTVTDISRALAAQNLQMPSGSVKAGSTEFTLRVMGRVPNVPAMADISVVNRDGRAVTIGDLGFVEDSTEEVKSASLYNDEPCVLLNIRKQSGENTVEVAHALKQRLDEIKHNAPEEFRIEEVRDQSIFVEAAVDTVKEHLVIGGVLAVIVVLMFLSNLRATIIAGVSIPASIISAFTVVKLMGFTLNGITLLALALSVGIVIDDAIVVMENIFRYIEEKKYKPFQAALAATSEIGLAVMAITLSLVAVFLPIAMMDGIVGQFLKSFGITMSVTIMVSMLVSFTLTPMMASRWFKAAVGATEDGLSDAASHAGGHGGSSKNQPIYHVVETFYKHILTFSLRHRWIVIVAVVGCMATLFPLMKTVRKNFLPDDDTSDFQISVQAPEGTTLEATQVIVARLARDVRTLGGVRYTIASVADTEQRNPYQGTVYVRLVNLAQREYNQQQVMNYVRTEVLPKYAVDNLRLAVVPAAVFSGGGMSTGDIQYMIGGPDMKKLEEYAKTLMDALRKVEGAVDVDSSLSTGKPQYGLRIDRDKASDLGVSVSDIANTLRLLVAGDKVTDYNEKGEQYEVHVRSMAEKRNDITELAMVTVPSNKFGPVPLGDVVHFEKGDGPAQINRLNRTRQVTINCNLAPNTSQQMLVDKLNDAVKDMNMGPDYITGLLGKTKEMKKTFEGFIMVFIMAFIFVYLVIAAQFESWLHPITILLSLPLTLPFAVLSLILFNQSINIFSLLGILVLFAVVKKNSILQIDHTNQLRAAGMPRFEAIVAANLDRLRPILMTTVAFVAGMIPALVSNAEGAATNKAISGVVVGGQTLSLLLTLIATPVVYSLFDDLSIFLGRLFRWIKGNAPEADDSQGPDEQISSDPISDSAADAQTPTVTVSADTLELHRPRTHAVRGWEGFRD